MAKIIFIFFLACFATCQETENKRAVTEHQLLNDRGRTLQSLKRLMWLHNAMGGVHTASGRDLSQAHVLLTSKEQDLSDLYDTMDREEMSDMMEPLLLELLGRGTPFTKIPKANLLHYLKNGKGHQVLQDLSDLFQMGSQDGKRNLSAQM
ncbi:parathyroid hormone 4-like [Ahaetulla prasina]|uniref:parathyroid hormone 4-like n=1 Tax=Ahaetulla prasina TaxID=499056 RepID=UPI002648416E|nr:parathyroid hormone 4-like [Ahaetulla prasina]